LPTGIELMVNSIIGYRDKYESKVYNNDYGSYIVPNYTVLKCQDGEEPIVAAELQDIVEALHFCKKYYTMVKPDNDVRLVIHNHATREETYYNNPNV
jgi:hypothetical protein